MNRTDREPLTPQERVLADRLARESAGASPSAALDAAILGAARAATSGGTPPAHVAVARRPRSLRRRRWPLAAGIAASLALAVGIAWQLRPIPVEAPRPAAEAPAAHHAAAEPVAPPEAQMLRARVHTPPQAESDAPGLSTPAAPASEPPRAAADAPRASDTARHGEASIATRGEALATTSAAAASAITEPETAFGAAAHGADGPSPSPAIATVTPARPLLAPAVAVESATRHAAMPARSASGQATRSAARALTFESIEDVPDDLDPPATADAPEVRTAWLARVRELLDTGRIDDARASLAEFHRRHPQAELPADLRALLD